MKSPDLLTLTIDQLVERFADLARAQNDALIMDEIGKFNRLFDQLELVEAELKAREGDQRRALLPLYNDRNMQVRVTAAKATLAVAPEEARQQLREIASSRQYPQAGDAGMTIWTLDEGIFKPE